VLADPNMVLVFPAGRCSRVSHPVTAEDECLVLDFSRNCFQDALSDAVGEQVHPSVATHYALAPSTMACRHLLWQRLERRLAGPLEIEETCLAMLLTVLRSVCDQRKRPALPSRSKTLDQI
jgi:hypothetical protein